MTLCRDALSWRIKEKITAQVDIIILRINDTILAGIFGTGILTCDILENYWNLYKYFPKYDARHHQHNSISP